MKNYAKLLQFYNKKILDINMLFPLQYSIKLYKTRNAAVHLEINSHYEI